MSELTKFPIRIDGVTYNEVYNPAVVFDTSIMRRVRIGEYTDMVAYWQVATTAYREGGFPEMAEDLVVLELPRDQVRIDEMLDNESLLATYYEEYLAKM